jgi:hypothetical protein
LWGYLKDDFDFFICLGCLKINKLVFFLLIFKQSGTVFLPCFIFALFIRK